MTSPVDFVVHSDGASRKDGRGGWGVTILDNAAGKRHDFFGGEYDTTNNRMELIAAIEGVLFLPEGASAEVISDSQYVVLGMSENVQDWEARRWRTSANKPVKNVDLWKELIDAAEGKDITWLWVRGHTGNEGNERADRLAAQGVPEPKAANLGTESPPTEDDVRSILAHARANGIKEILLYER